MLDLIRKNPHPRRRNSLFIVPWPKMISDQTCRRWNGSSARQGSNPSLPETIKADLFRACTAPQGIETITYGDIATFWMMDHTPQTISY